MNGSATSDVWSVEMKIEYVKFTSSFNDAETPAGFVSVHIAVRLISVRMVPRKLSSLVMKVSKITAVVPAAGGSFRKLLPKESIGKRIVFGNCAYCPQVAFSNYMRIFTSRDD